MLLFIVKEAYEAGIDSLFQYISCCYLSFSCQLYWGQKIVSIHLMLLFIKSIKLILRYMLSFNTSHVVIYQVNKDYIEKYKKFQYISCCYLSSKSLSGSWLFTAFQYISCCYLSQ